MIVDEKIGIIGAGKVGASLGVYFSRQGLVVTGFYDVDEAYSRMASERIKTRCYAHLEDLVAESDVILVTVPDDLIGSVWKQCLCFPMKGKCCFHCSGVLGSDVFSGHEAAGVSVGSMHPVCAVNSKDSGDVFSGKFFVLEGDETGLKMLKSIMTTTGNDYRVISTGQKTRYHAAAVASSNLICALAGMAEEWMRDCGFDGKTAHELLVPLMLVNMEHVAEQGVMNALTGPVERGDAGTVAKHLALLEGDDREIYRLLSLRLVKIAEEKHPDKDFTNLLNVLMK